MAKEMTYEEWLETYKPIRGETSSEDDESPMAFDCDDKRKLNEALPEGRVWSIVDADDGLVIVPGWRMVNVFGRLITEIPFTGDASDFRVEH